VCADTDHTDEALIRGVLGYFHFFALSAVTAAAAKTKAAGGEAKFVPKGNGEEDARPKKGEWERGLEVIVVAEKGGEHREEDGEQAADGDETQEGLDEGPSRGHAKEESV